MKHNKGGAIFWGMAVVVLELIFFLALIAVAIATQDMIMAVVSLFPLMVAVFTAYFLKQRLGEIKEEEIHKEEYDKY